MGNYVTVEEIRNAKVKGNRVTLNDFSDIEIEQEISVAEATIEKLTGDIFYGKIEINKFNGSKSTKQFFGPTIPYKLLDVFSVSNKDIDGSVLDSYIRNQDYYSYPYYIEIGRWVPGDSPRRAFGTGGVWPSGQENIEIEGVWGYEPLKSGVGTVSIASDDLTTVVGTNTLFTVDLRPNALIYIDGEYYTVSEVRDKTKIILTENFEGDPDTSYTYKFFNVPADIRKAAKLLTLEYLKPGSSGLTRDEVTEVSWPDFTIRFRNTDEKSMTTGFVFIDNILANNINMSTMFMVTD